MTSPQECGWLAFKWQWCPYFLMSADLIEYLLEWATHLSGPDIAAFQGLTGYLICDTPMFSMHTPYFISLSSLHWFSLISCSWFCSKFCCTYVHFSLVSRPWPILVCLIQLRYRTMRFWASFWPKRAQSQDLKCHFDPEIHNYTNCSWALFWSKQTSSSCPTAFY